ncbi:hypothetical protein [Polyangium sp. 6x1]|uniref:hypothetical protein n=1 Tax=Polyangium sp. 6x1 TaxID=3042689 RepID=UPI002482FE7C|nr:hypothetical protein [Polyangium sp. 6x1]MDI1452114.1 hypothetical protein [Polyangium sp. 6x1]
MTRDREIAGAISDGINCIYAFVTALRAGASPTPVPEWLTTLQEMERALDGVMAKEVMTSMVVGEEERDRVRRVSALVADWIATGAAPSELQTTAEAVLRFFGLRI